MNYGDLFWLIFGCVVAVCWTLVAIFGGSECDHDDDCE